MSEVVLGVHPSVHAAYKAHRKARGVATTALSHTLDRVALAEPVVKVLEASHPRWRPG